MSATESDGTSAAPTDTAAAADDSTGAELSFDMEYDGSDAAAGQTITVVKPISEAAADPKPEAETKPETETNDGWSAVITSSVSAQTALESTFRRGRAADKSARGRNPT